jgi:hypothetical protein
MAVLIYFFVLARVDALAARRGEMLASELCK